MEGGGGSSPNNDSTITTSSLNGRWTAGTADTDAFTSETLQAAGIIINIQNASENTCEISTAITGIYDGQAKNIGDEAAYMEGTVKQTGDKSWLVTWSGTYGSGSCELTLSSTAEAELTFNGTLQEDGTEFTSEFTGSAKKESSNNQNNNQENNQENNQQENNNENTGSVSIESLNGTWTANGGSGSGTGTGKYNGYSSPVTIDSMTIRIKDAAQGSSTLGLNWKVHATHNYGVFDPDWGDYYDTLPVSSSGSNSYSIHWTGSDGDFTFNFSLSSQTSATCTISGTLWEEDNPSSTRINFSVTSPMTRN